jgi:hypothetical protein
VPMGRGLALQDVDTRLVRAHAFDTVQAMLRRRPG